MTFDGYKTGEEIGWGDESTVYDASGPDAGGGEALAIKIRGYQHEAEGAALLQAARAQQSAASAGCTRIAPIMACGLAQHSAYYVTKKYPRSVLSMIQRKVAVRPEGLHEMSGQVLAGLRELQSRQGRSHGNLKPSNILLLGTSRLRDSNVFLSDLAGEPVKDFAADIHAFGRCMYELVRRREVHSFDWPIAPSAEWNLLGPSGEAWRVFCNKLLDPAAAASPDPLAAAEQALKELDRKAGGAKGAIKPILAVVAGLVLLAGGAAGVRALLSHLHSQSSTASAESSSEGGSGWFAALAGEINREPGWTSDDPYVGANITGPIRNLKLSDTEIAALKKNGAVAGNNAETMAAVGAAYDAWPAKATVDQAYGEFTARGWTIPAGSLAKLRGGLPEDRPVLPQIAAVSHAARVIPEIQLRWRLMGELFAKLEGSGDPVLSNAPAFVKADVGEAPDLDHVLTKLDEDSDRLTSLFALNGEADRSRRQVEGKFAGFSGTVNAQVLKDWEEDAKRFRPAGADAAKLEAGWGKAFDELAAKIQAGGKEKEQLNSELDRLRSEAKASLHGLVEGDLDRVDQATREKIAALDRKLGNAAAAAMAPQPPTVVLPSAAPGKPDVGLPALPDGTLADRQTFERLVNDARSRDFSKASPGAVRDLRNRLVADLKKTSPAFQAKIAGFVSSLSTLQFKEADAAASGPPLAGWQGPAPGLAGIGYLWGKYRLDFTLIPSEGEKAACYLASTELPVGLFIDWVAAHGGPGAVSLRTDVTMRGPHAWEMREGALALRRDWTWATTMTSVYPFYAPKAPPPEPPSAAMPMNYVSSRTAVAFAATLGARLSSPEEWERGYRLAKEKGWETGQGNLRDQSWEEQQKYIAECIQGLKAKHAELRDPPWPDGDIFIPSHLSVGKEAAARPATGNDDRHLWFAPVTEAAKPLGDLIGNVAEYVSEDAGGSHVYVVGGSALSPPEIDPATPYELSAAQKQRGFSDVGFRLALTPAGGGADESPDVEAFRRIVQDAQAPQG